MKSVFNGTCSLCGHFLPGCASVFMRRVGKATEYVGEPVVLCGTCRAVKHGSYRLDGRHRRAKS